METQRLVARPWQCTHRVRCEILHIIRTGGGETFCCLVGSENRSDQLRASVSPTPCAQLLQSLLCLSALCAAGGWGARGGGRASTASSPCPHPWQHRTRSNVRQRLASLLLHCVPIRVSSETRLLAVLGSGGSMTTIPTRDAVARMSSPMRGGCGCDAP